MAKKIYVGIDSIARKAKKGYIGIDNVARKLKKAYIGVGGIARQFFSSEQKLVYYGNATNLSAGRRGLASTSIGDYAIFGGGFISGSSCSATVDTYTKDLVKGTASSLSAARGELTATAVGDYALFGGGKNNSYLTAVNAYQIV